ncbi:DUF3566 domain-containing protein [uncultured Jatrophihabitans sp.]|uniref:DUF3566 domain-containing protein n=1 Tax=uncultured Jatrophihabitans sp. TaxID=1610747 RepID=UPI0035CC6DCB
MTQGGAPGATGGRSAQQTAPRSPDYGFSAPQHTTSGSAPGSWSPAGPAGPAHGQATADSTTGSLPSVPEAPTVQTPPAPMRQAQTPPPQGANQQAGANGAANPSGGKSRAARNRGPRRARLQLRHINPWTVLKFSCVLSIALFFVWLIVVGVLYGILDGAGIIGKINDTVTTIQGNNADAPVTAGVVFGGAAIIGVVNVVLFIALSTIGSLVYNLCADLVGGIEITLSER